jgi:hypothetical protein
MGDVDYEGLCAGHAAPTANLTEEQVGCVIYLTKTVVWVRHLK